MANKVAYLMSWFPARTETFILYEILELERRGMQVEIYPLLGQKEGASHPGAQALVKRANYRSYFSKETLNANLYWLKKEPKKYLSAWKKALFGNVTSPGFLARSLVAVPKAALMAKELAEKKVEHVHAHWATHPALAAYTIKELTGIPYSITAHAHDLYVDRSMLAEKLRAASFAVTISDFNRKLIEDWCGEDAAKKTEVIHCGIDSQVFSPVAKGVHGQPFTIVCVASLRDYKGHPYLIEACRLLKQRGRKFRALFVGDGEDRLLVEELIARAGLTQDITLLGHQPQDKVSEIVRKADVAVLPSIITGYGKMEGIPVALMEAMACEVPVVATTISGIPELVKHEQTGLLVPQKNARALANALERLIVDPEFARELGRAGRKHVLERFDLHRNAGALYQLLKRASLPVQAVPEPEQRAG